MLNYQQYRQHLLALTEAALDAADPYLAVTRTLHKNGRLLQIGSTTHNLDQGRVFLVSIGKAGQPMAQGAANILESDLHKGIIITKASPPTTNQKPKTTHHASLTTYHASHPVSDQRSITATQAALDLLTQTDEDDLVLCLISGGASALFTKPLIPLADWQQLNQALLASGCTISEFNCVRRRLDQVKGGGLARAAAPAVCVSLILSDVVGNPLADIGSGPTVLTNETATDALQILQRYDIEHAVETAVWEKVTAVLNQPPHPAIEMRNSHTIVGDVRSAAQAAAQKAAELGFTTQLLTAQIEGEAREIGKVAAAMAKDAPANHCLIMGGETTVTLRGDGIGGRNLETALSAAVSLAGSPRRVVASFATDGDDGPTQAAGAVVGGETVEHGRLYQLNALTSLENNDSYTYFQQLDIHLSDPQQTLIHTGLTGTNVNDLIFILTYGENS